MGEIIKNGISQDIEDALIPLGYKFDTLNQDLDKVRQDKVLLAQACQIAVEVKSVGELRNMIEDILLLGSNQYGYEIEILILAIEIKRHIEQNKPQAQDGDSLVREIIESIKADYGSNEIINILRSLNYGLDELDLARVLNEIRQDKVKLSQVFQMAAEAGSVEDLKNEIQDVLAGISKNEVELLILAIEIKKRLEQNAAQATTTPQANQPEPQAKQPEIEKQLLQEAAITVPEAQQPLVNPQPEPPAKQPITEPAASLPQDEVSVNADSDMVVAAVQGSLKDGEVIGEVNYIGSEGSDNYSFKIYNVMITDKENKNELKFVAIDDKGVILNNNLYTSEEKLKEAIKAYADQVIKAAAKPKSEKKFWIKSVWGNLAGAWKKAILPILGVIILVASILPGILGLGNIQNRAPPPRNKDIIMDNAISKDRNKAKKVKNNEDEILSLIMKNRPEFDGQGWFIIPGKRTIVYNPSKARQVLKGLEPDGTPIYSNNFEISDFNEQNSLDNELKNGSISPEIYKAYKNKYVVVDIDFAALLDEYMPKLSKLVSKGKVSFTSGFRSAAYLALLMARGEGNAAVNSMHLLGSAADILLKMCL